MLRLRLEYHSAGAIAEQHAGGAILPVEDARERFRTDDDGALELPGLDEIIGNSECVDEARAHGLHVEGRTLGDAEALLDLHRRRRKGAVGRCRRADDEIDVDRIDSGAYERLLGGGDAKIGREFVVAGDVPLTNAGALDDPLVAGIDDLRQVGIGHDALGQVGADTADH